MLSELTNIQNIKAKSITSTKISLSIIFFLLKMKKIPLKKKSISVIPYIFVNLNYGFCRLHINIILIINICNQALCVIQHV